MPGSILLTQLSYRIVKIADSQGPYSHDAQMKLRLLFNFMLYEPRNEFFTEDDFASYSFILSSSYDQSTWNFTD